ncbi:hypothetical protein ACF3NW_09015 [Eikenella halliae]|uniref:hypothetical protein n=1 Tax=Eikenella halliae TaxID=1795832 RepID=UPI0028D1FF04|nr:hypothetical protein [Eikenella halliae]
MIKTSIDNKHEQEIVIFNECAIPSEEIVQMMMDKGVPLNEESVYQLDSSEEAIREFCCALIQKLEIEIQDY